MKTFEQAWEEKGYQYGEDALEGVKLGWDLAIHAMASMLNEESKAALIEAWSTRSN